MTDRRPTGLSVLDRQLRGGVPAGSLVALVTPPEAQSDLLLDAMAASGPCLYLSTTRPEPEVRASLPPAASQETTVDRVGLDDLATPESVFAAVPDEGYVVLDTAEPLELLNRGDQLAAMDALVAALVDRDAVGLVRCLGIDEDDRPRRRTLQRADSVWTLRLIVTTLSIENRLIVSKFREGAALTEPVKLKLTDQVTIDTSRDIA